MRFPRYFPRVRACMNTKSDNPRRQDLLQIEMSRAKKHRGDGVSITGVELLTEQNHEDHHTDEYDCPSHLLVRRGAPLNLQVTFSRPLSGDSVCVELHRGYRTTYRRGTRFTAELGLSPKYPHQLELKELKAESSKVTLSLLLPADFPVGSYRVEVEVTPQGSRRGERQDADREMVVLFNPWCRDDTVYLSEETEREEYIMNESGVIWAGAHDNMFNWPWNFAQFEEVSVLVALYLLDMHRTMDSDLRKDPVRVARALTEMVNMEDGDGGVLFGLWSPNEEEYADGTDPTAWSGSSAILEEFWESKKAVRYGQCWVFGGLLTTVLRTLGIPARPVTNFESAHDGDANRTLDRYWDLQDQMVEEKSHDSIWNYHVWVEAWMTRPDLGSGYGGWQAVDATPQEISPHSQSYVVGPVSLAAVKNGQDLPYDTEFVIAEVNADILDYCEVEKDKFELAVADTTRVGKNVSTKAVGSNERKDVTRSYKYKEGSLAERAALGVESGGGASDVQLEVQFSGQATIGEDFDVVVKMKSKAKKARNVSVRVLVSAVTYTGTTGSSIQKGQDTIHLEKEGWNGSFVLPVTASHYLESLKDQALLSVTALAMVEETKQSWVTKLPYRLHRPDLTFVVDGRKVADQLVTLQAGGSYPVKAFFTNPLSKSLTNVMFHIEGAKLTKSQKISGRSTARGKMVEVSFTISPRRPRKKVQECKLIVTCQSKELKGIMGTATISVTQ